MNKIALKGSMLIGSLGIFLIDALPASTVTFIIFFTGMVALYLGNVVMRALQNQKTKPIDMLIDRGY
ncbi:hypothetical protein GCM10010912_58990 [Paenibacillus albidus]|uniref:Uncharacterized protein n=2 Tax=Paenibacillus albidus TaxID=2041023 RepID=A0A917D1D2_9BACL|nr:hypothetical protein GCM10010912_58990 [Paenibacillus albidus]